MFKGLKSIWHIGALISVLVVTACAGYEPGSGPITLSEKVEAGFQEYLKLKVPLAFAVTTDGENAGWYFCNHISTCTQSVAEGKAVSFCRKGAAEGAECKIYAVGKKVVWDGPVMTASGNPKAQGVLVGKGPIVVSEKVARAFDAYKGLPDPLAFAVSLDGKNAGWFSCNFKNTCADVEAKPLALETCLKYSNPNSGCRIYAIGKVVVWEGPVTVENAINSIPKVAQKPKPEIIAKTEPKMPGVSMPQKVNSESTPGAEPKLEKELEAKVESDPNEEPKAKLASISKAEEGAAEEEPTNLPMPKKEGFLKLPDTQENTQDMTTLASSATPDMPPIEAVPSKPVSEIVLPEPTVRMPSIANDILSLSYKLRNSKAFNDIEEEIKRLQIN